MSTHPISTPADSFVMVTRPHSASLGRSRRPGLAGSGPCTPECSGQRLLNLAELSPARAGGGPEFTVLLRFRRSRGSNSAPVPRSGVPVRPKSVHFVAVRRYRNTCFTGQNRGHRRVRRGRNRVGTGFQTDLGPYLSERETRKNIEKCDSQAQLKLRTGTCCAHRLAACPGASLVAQHSRCQLWTFAHMRKCSH